MTEKNSYDSNQMMREFKWQLERPGIVAWIWIIFLALLVLLIFFHIKHLCHQWKY